MNITEKNEFQLLIRYTDYCAATSQTAESNKPEWFDMDQHLALSIIYKNMTQTHLFPMDRAMFRHMKDQYKLMFIKALAWQIKYVNDNQELYDNPTGYMSSRQVGTFNRGALSTTDIDKLLETLAPKAKFYLEQMGWLYKSLSDQYELSQFYDATIDDDYATESFVLEKMEDAMAYADLADQGVKTYIEEYWLQNQDGYGANKYLKVVEENNELKFKWVDLGGIVQDNLLQWDNETKEIFKGTEGAYTIVDDILLGNKTVLARINEEVERAKAREDEIESKIPSPEEFVTKSYVDTQDQNIKAYVDEQVAEAGKVQDVKVNGDSVVTDKVANIDLTSYALQTSLDTTNENLLSEATTRASQVSTLTNDVNTLKTTKANSADVYTKTQTDSQIDTKISQSVGRYITSSTTGGNFATKAALVAGPYYYNGSTVTLINTDYAIVAKDEDHDNAQTRYIYTGSQWNYQYTISTTITSEQQAALDSTITKDKVTIYDGYAEQIAGKQDTINDLETIRTGAVLGNTAVQPDSLAKVATSGSYNDLNNKPTIPSIEGLATKTELETESNRAIAKETELGTAITNETSARTSADEQLQTNIDNCEKTANKTTTLDTTSDTKYPTCKAVYDYIQSLDGNDIEY